jgi:hypothetical protein
MLDKRSVVPTLLFFKCCYISFEQEKSMGTRLTGHIKVVAFFCAVPHKADTGTSLSKSFQDNLLTDHRKTEAITQKWKMKACFYLAALSV